MSTCEACGGAGIVHVPGNGMLPCPYCEPDKALAYINFYDPDLYPVEATP